MRATIYSVHCHLMISCSAMCLGAVDQCVQKYVGELPGPCLHRANFIFFYILVYGDLISKLFWSCICGLLVCCCEGRSTG